MNQRKSLFKNLIKALIVYGEIKTTESRAKAIRSLVDKLITRGKTGTLSSRRMIWAFLQNKQVVGKIVDELGPLFRTRPGGFTRMVRLGRRRGDNAMMVRLELIERPKGKEKKTKEKPKREKKLNKKMQPPKRKRSKSAK